jgi:hypothetical protein
MDAVKEINRLFKEVDKVFGKAAEIFDGLLKSHELVADRYKISNAPGVTVQDRGHGHWAVVDAGYVLNKEGQWEYEPMSSSRTEEFIRRTRYLSAEQALQAFKMRKKKQP